MSGWWHETVTNGDLVMYLLGAGAFYVMKELGIGFAQGWKRGGRKRNRPRT